MLPNNSAWATRIPYKNKEKELVGYTNCTAIENGWVWNIPLWSRIGTGYVYSDKFVSDEDALKEFQKYLGTKELEFKNIKMRVGLHNRLWVKNVVAIGLSAGFIEPLESNGLFTVHEFLMILLRNIQRDKFSQFDRDSYNYQAKHLFRNFAEFVALHYALSHRNDTEYWKANLNINWDEIFVNLKPQIIVPPH
jgi:tryptophan halogenase